MMISYGKQSVNQEDIEEVVKVLQSNFLTQGDKVIEFESSLCEYFGSKYSIALANGTAALHLAGLALGWKESDIVITSPLTFLATVNSIVYSGSTPDFVDIDPDTYCIDVNQLEKKLKFYDSKGKRVKSVIGVDFAGQPCDWNSIKELSNKYGFSIVNDNCHAIGASYYEDKKYACNFADLVIQSYHPVKNITTGEGGAVLTNNKELHLKIKSLRSHGMERNSKITESKGMWYYEMKSLGFNYRLTDIQCALGVSQLRKLDSFVLKRKKIAKSYDEFFKNRDSFLIPKTSRGNSHAYHLYPLKYEFSLKGINKKEFFKEARKKNLALQVHYIPVHMQPFYKKNYGFKQGSYPIAEDFYNKEISLPIYPDLERKDIEFVKKTLTQLL